MSSRNTASKEQNEIRKKLTIAFENSAENLGLIIDRDFLETIVRRLEREIHNATIRECENEYTERNWNNPKFISIYSTICYKVLANLDPISSVGGIKLAERILRGDLEPRAVCYLSSQDMNPQASQNERDIIEIRQKQGVDRKYTDKHPCKKCGERKVTYFEYQGRSADEMTTIKYECLECGYVW